jgi:hypothetical protein
MKPQRHHIETYQPRRPVTLRALETPEHSAPEAANEPLKCVWSGYPDYNRACRSRIPASVVVKAWQREMHLEEAVEGFFYFTWRSGVWLAFGSRDGRVRGVYCPTHCSERDTRGVQVEDRQDDQSKGVALQ